MTNVFNWIWIVTGLFILFRIDQSLKAVGEISLCIIFLFVLIVALTVSPMYSIWNTRAVSLLVSMSSYLLGRLRQQLRNRKGASK